MIKDFYIRRGKSYKQIYSLLPRQLQKKIFEVPLLFIIHVKNNDLNVYIYLHWYLILEVMHRIWKVAEMMDMDTQVTAYNTYQKNATFTQGQDPIWNSPPRNEMLHFEMWHWMLFTPINSHKLPLPIYKKILKLLVFKKNS